MKPLVPFWVAILVTIASLLIVTGALLIFYNLHRASEAPDTMGGAYAELVLRRPE